MLLIALPNTPDVERVPAACQARVAHQADNSLLIFSELGSYKPLNWMAAPCTIKDITPDHADDDVETEVPQKVIRASADKSNDVLEVTLQHIYSDETYDLGEDPGLIKDGVEDHLQKYLAEQIERIGEGATLVRREYRLPLDRSTSWPSTPAASMLPSKSRETVVSTASSSSLATANYSIAILCWLPYVYFRRADHHSAGPRACPRPRLRLPDPRL